MTPPVRSLIRLVGFTAIIIASACTYTSAEKAELTATQKSSIKIETSCGQKFAALSKNPTNNPRKSKITQDDQYNKPEQPSAGKAISLQQDSSHHEVSDNIPLVAYEQGQLTITAENVPLSEILSALHTAMGTEVDLPATATNERIWAHLGPGPASKILTDLLSNTDLNYVIQASAKDLNGIQSVMLTVRSDGGPGKPEVSIQSAGRVNDRQRANSAATEVSEEKPPASQESTVAADATPPLPDAPTVEPHTAPGTANSAAVSSIPNPSPPAVLSEQHIVEQLTNMYQQRKQIQQNQTAATPN
jgi:hypothetical protein